MASCCWTGGKGHNDSCGHLTESGIVRELKKEYQKELDELMPTDPDPDPTSRQKPGATSTDPYVL